MKICSFKKLCVAAFLGGPLAGCYMLSRNFKALGNKSASVVSIWAGILGVLLLMLLPEPPTISDFTDLPKTGDTNTWSLFLVLLCFGIVTTVARKTQGQEIQTQLQAGVAEVSNWYVAGVILVSIVITCILAYVVLRLLSPNLDPFAPM